MESRDGCQLFGIKIRGRIPPEQPENLFFFQHWNLFRIAVFSKPIVVQKVTAPKLSIG
jgi:hypothetical protein